MIRKRKTPAPPTPPTETSSVPRSPLVTVRLRKPRVLEPSKTKRGKLNGVTFEDIEAAIMVSDGYISRISEYLGISIHMVKKHMEKFPTLGRLMQDHREKKTDGAEKVIEDKMADGNLLAAIFYLKCHGKDRGWIERAEQQRQGPAKIEVTIRPAKGVQHQPVTTSIDAEFVDVTAQEGQGKAEKERSGKLLFLPQPK